MRDKDYKIEEQSSLIYKLPKNVISQKGNIINIKDDLVKHIKVFILFISK